MSLAKHTIVRRFHGYDVYVNDGTRLDKLCSELQHEFPKLQLHHGRDLWHQLFQAKLLFWNKGYLSHMTTTRKNKIYLSDDAHRRAKSGLPSDQDSLWGLLMHERVHLRQFRRYGSLVFILGYLLVFFPFGLAWFRAWMEKPGYMETLRSWAIIDPAWLLAKSNNEYTCVQWLVNQFVGPNYGWMVAPWRKTVTRWFAEEHAKLLKEM